MPHPARVEVFCKHTHTHTHTHIYIYIYIYHHHQVASSAWIYPWPFLTSLLYRPSLLAGLKGYFLYRHRAVVCTFSLVVLPLLVYVKGSSGVRHLCVRPYFSSSIPHVWSVYIYIYIYIYIYLLVILRSFFTEVSKFILLNYSFKNAHLI